MQSGTMALSRLVMILVYGFIVMLITMRFVTTTFKGKPLMEATRAD
ncbi:MAG: hypothetical protein LBN04_01740 [Oscillospiraceae bacterium]|jgi:preprotein translocase subunit SecG|nr:hypothetical protein [Oscillospiraceae bacterium]